MFSSIEKQAKSTNQNQGEGEVKHHIAEIDNEMQS